MPGSSINLLGGGYKILDTHLGSGSSRIAAYWAGLDFYGCEIDKDYFERMQKRFDQQCRGIIRIDGQNTIVEQTLF